MSSTPDNNSPPPMPLWVKVFAVTAAIVVLLIVIALIWFPGKHGPGRHIHGHSATAEGLELAA